MKNRLSLLFLAVATLGFAQENVSYQKPSAEILKLADYDRPPSIMMDSKRETLILTYRSTYKTLEDLIQDEMKLGGLRINPVTNISSTMTYSNNLKIKKVNAKSETQVTGLPQNARLAYFQFSPDEKFLAFTNTTAKGVELWIVDLASASAKKLTSDNLNANMGSPYSWFRDSKALLVNQLLANRPALLDDKNNLPTGPTVSTSDGKVSQNRTYQDLLKNPQDEKNFETLVTSELYKVNVDGTSSLFKKADMYAGQSFSPSGKYVNITTLQKPFSYIVPLSRFPMTSVVYDESGNEIKKVNEIPLTEIMPKGFSATREGKRNMTWRSDKPAVLYFVQALDGGDPAKNVDFRDEVFTWEAPFNTAPKSLVKVKDRFAGIQWGDDQHAIVSDSWYDTRNVTTQFLNPSTGDTKLISKRNFQDIYSDPGEFQTKRNEFGRDVIDVEANKSYLLGDGFTKEGQFPFIDSFDWNSLKTTRLYTSNVKDKKEDLIDILNIKKNEILVREQSKNEYPNYYIKNFKSGKLTPVTQFSNPFASIKDVTKEVIHYKRNDGVDLTGTLYLPAGYNKKDKLPLLIWAYPEEFKDKATAGQNSKNPNEFTFPSYGSFIYWAAKGYAVLDDASFPIIGEGKTEPNDTFITQLVADGKAAIDAVDKLGYIDRKKVAVGGHSYGAFMTANLLTHSDLFACGIARSGAYNRTLTPFGFQSEQRNYWDVPNVYNEMSPFMNANKMKTPMLLVHGEADNNPGTFTLQTERYFQALKNLGAPVRMVLLPKESHGYVAKENILHLLWEQDQFLEKCLKTK
ncbi:prolyl oligopeptidase family serine peptidase [Soonwooa sp.]|uniref:alpha/beta hydrolase family protein n=1 Tax=Soonwooa sp. TaxID=1938592 RepID=UPI0028AA1BB6|nr:prolyl oligopeptidase family serine peptidase [Soonwooa sp.]